ncbi:ATP-binding cassette domain-containing protein [Nocardioides sp. CFH 31398]|uniref:ATP-binding cassette domain-containing protein n=1 Tax=Nocardioides sp. CFH 31398 TaxID=2919579 RepID=UPI001F051345|nr:ATP-binding cassette domain-containing protein [Nocardioides sp. CFH 31398]MCH1865193.1 ATP-binding cassette domain-containing protein [Nocardioides sp. CFH 31398]
MIEVTGLVKRFGSTTAVAGVSFTARDGAVTGFIGPNGAGKSTVLKAVSGLLAPDEGTATIDGHRLGATALPPDLRGVFLSAEWIPAHQTARSFLTYLCQVQGLPASRVDEVLRSVGLLADANRKIKGYSLGMRQRVGIGAAVMTQPRNLVLDEPINGLDPEGIRWIRDVIRGVADRGGAVLLSSHHMSELSMVADHVVMIDRGRIVHEGAVTDGRVQGSDAAGPRRVYVESPDLGLAARLLRAADLEVRSLDRGAIVTGAGPEDVGRVVFSGGGSLSHLAERALSIEDVYFRRSLEDEEAVR